MPTFKGIPSGIADNLVRSTWGHELTKPRIPRNTNRLLSRHSRCSSASRVFPQPCALGSSHGTGVPKFTIRVLLCSDKRGEILLSKLQSHVQLSILLFLTCKSNTIYSIPIPPHNRTPLLSQPTLTFHKAPPLPRNPPPPPKPRKGHSRITHPNLHAPVQTPKTDPPTHAHINRTPTRSYNPRNSLPCKPLRRRSILPNRRQRQSNPLHRRHQSREMVGRDADP